MTQQAPSSPLHFLANVISDMPVDLSSRSQSPSSSSSSSAGPSSPQSAHSYPATKSFLDAVCITRLHFPCSFAESVHSTVHTPLKHSTSPNQAPQSPTMVPFIRHKSAKRTRKTAGLNLKTRMQMKTRRKELMEKASKIKSLDNSPVNERQLLVLRMIYDEITMYPCESWMVLVAIIIHRAYKQVKNWFSNERQKNKPTKDTNDTIPCETEEGDKVRMRNSALSVCQEWSDSFFEEVVMIYNYRVQRNSHFREEVIRRPPSVSDPHA